jgi:hypothetical protein
VVDPSVDADGDGLADAFEGTEDRDGDGLANALDTDSDGDGISDAEESGRRGPCFALQSDDDGIPDYLDTDSDDDGLSDEEERSTHGTSPYEPDTDGDGFSDLAEIASAEADPLDRGRGVPVDDFYVVLPFGGPVEQRELSFRTRVRQADVFFLMDRTGSMTAEVDRLRVDLRTIVAGMVAEIPDLAVGLGGFAGFGGPHARTCGEFGCGDGEGAATDIPFNLYGVVTTDVDAMQSMVDMLRADLGGAIWASFNEALFQSATGAGVLPWAAPQTCVAAPDDEGPRFGYPCFRPGSLPILVVLTDTSSRNGPLTGPPDGTYDTSMWDMGRAATYEATRDALRAIDARVIGVVSAGGSNPACTPPIPSPLGFDQFAEYARETGTVDASGAPIVFQIECDGSGLGETLVDAVRTLAEQTPHDVSAVARDGDELPVGTPPLDATRFLVGLAPGRLERGGGTTACPDASACDDERFFAVAPDARVVFSLRFQNDFAPPGRTARVYRAEIVVLGNERAELDSREVLILVPASSSPLLE